MATPVALIASRFAPATPYSGGGSPAVLRGENVVLRRFDDLARLESYPGSKDLSEDYDLTTGVLTGTLAWNTTSPTAIVGTTTLFGSELHIGQMFLMDTEVFVVRSIESDLALTVDRAPIYWSSNKTGKTGYRLPVLFNIDNKRGVLLRGNAISIDRKDIILVGDGKFYINGTDTGFTASPEPARLQRSATGTYTQFPIGFDTAPVVPDVAPTTGGTKGMVAGSYSFRFAWYNNTTRGFSDCTEVVKQHSGSDIVIAAAGRFQIDFTATFAAISFADTDITIATGNINKTAHGLITGDVVKWRNTGTNYPTPTAGAALDVGTPYYVIKVDADNFKLSRTSGGSAILFSADGDPTNYIYKCPANADGVLVYMSQSGGGVAAVNTQYFANGPWYQVGPTLITDLDTAGKSYVEALDGELGNVATGDNDPAPRCEYVANFANTVMYLSCLGKRISNQDIHGINPGSYILSQKPSNFEGVPLTWRVSVGQDITGFALGVGRLFCQTADGIYFVTPTGRTELGRLSPTLLDFPYTSRPFFTKGSIQPYGLYMIQGNLFSYSGAQPLQSPSEADEHNFTPFELGLFIDDLLKPKMDGSTRLPGWADGHTLARHDPKNQQFIVIGSATKQNSSGYWISELLPLDLRRGEWMPKIVLSSTTRDMIVSGAEVINGRLELLVGGRVSGGAFQTKTYRYDELAGSTVPYYVAFTVHDFQEKQKNKVIKSFRPTGKLSSPVLQVHGAAPGHSIAISDIENGTNSLTGNISLSTTTAITRYLKKKRMVKNLALASVRLAGTYPGSGDPDRLDELVIEVDVTGGLR